MSDDRTIAEAATPGPWAHTHAPDDSYGSPINRIDPEGSRAAIGFLENCHAPDQEFANGAFIAHFNPAKILAMLDELEALREAGDGLYLIAKECRLPVCGNEPLAAWRKAKGE